MKNRLPTGCYSSREAAKYLKEIGQVWKQLEKRRTNENRN